ncbi:MAG: glycosyltransferase family 4 protein [Salibacteraceae bacterium]
MTSILYISPLWSGAEDFLTQGSDEFKGMPAFAKVLMGAINSDRIERVYGVFFSRKPLKTNISPQFSSKLEIRVVHYMSVTEMFVKLPFFIIYVSFLILKWKINLVFGHGSIGAIGGIASRLTGVDYCQRIYGTFLINEINKPNWMLLMKHPLEFLAFKMDSIATIITNDGTHGDRVFRKINGHTDRLHFLLNGVDKESVESKTKSTTGKRIISYIARIDKWKRQHLLINALVVLKELGVNDVHGVFVGPIINDDYLEELRSELKKHNLNDRVEFMGAVSSFKAREVMMSSWITCSFYHTSNLGNVALESFARGIPLLAINCNDSMGSIPSDLYISVSDSPKDIAIAIQSLSNNDDSLNEMASNAKAWCDENLLSWNARATYELNIISRYKDD